ncbi:hypothetical protein FB451DRAFT_1050117, partial [Mycena latifolia]
VIKLPKQSRLLDMHTEGLYSLLLLYARSVWPQKMIISDGGLQTGTILASKVKSFGNVQVRGVKYGMQTHHRGKGYCYGFIEGRIPCRIDYLVEISLASGEIKQVAIVQRFAALDEEIVQDAVKNLPWHHWFLFILDAFTHTDGVLQ